jgi:hypothetical protein
MSKRLSQAALAALFSLGSVSGIQAQVVSAPVFTVPGYDAIIATPVGALAPILSRDLMMPERSPAVFHLRYGLRKDDSLTTHTLAGTEEFHLGAGRAAATAGVQRSSDATLIMAGVEYSTIFSRGLLTPNMNGPALVLSMKLEAGFSSSIEGDTRVTAFAGGFSIPMAVPLGTDIIIVPFAVIHNPSRLDLTLGANRVLLQEGTTVFGIGLTWNR